MTDIAHTPAAERIARVITAVPLSPNGEGPAGSERPVAEEVDVHWREALTRAEAVLRTLREPTQAMVDAGRHAGSDPAQIWSAMVRAAIAEPARERGTVL